MKAYMLLLTTNIDLHIANKSIKNRYKVPSRFPQTARLTKAEEQTKRAWSPLFFLLPR